MKQLTVRGVDHVLEARLREEAKRQGRSVNRMVLGILRRGLGLDEQEVKAKLHQDMDHLIGTWTVEEAKDFEAALRQQRQIDKEMWPS